MAKTHSYLGAGSAQDRQKLIRLERGATDQPAIHIRHREQVRGIARLDAATVENAGGGRNFSIPLADPRPDEGVHLLRLLGCSVAPGADRPHRLVGNHALSERTRATELEHRIELPRDDLAG